MNEAAGIEASLGLTSEEAQARVLGVLRPCGERGGLLPHGL